MLLESYIKTIRDLVAGGGPKPSEYEMLNDWFRDVMKSRRLGEITSTEVSLLLDAFGEALSLKTMQGFVVHKPHGYYGDFEIIDRIYTNSVCAESHLANWDYFFHACAATQAVRNRKAFFHEALDSLSKEAKTTSKRVLYVSCGPARDVLDYLSLRKNNNINFVCIDHDPKAISYARKLCKDYKSQITFCTCDLIRHLPDEEYDLVWSAGLFDYFSDRVFVHMLKRLLKRVVLSGKLLIGNFNITNPNRDYMKFGGWDLMHRTQEDLFSLAQEAGALPESFCVKKEPKEINLFLEITKKDLPSL